MAQTKHDRVWGKPAEEPAKTPKVKKPKEVVKKK